MAAEKIGRDGLSPVFPAAVRSHAPADAETIKSLAGRARWLYEMASGSPGGDAEHAPACPLNPSGRLGHDHSGPPYGSAFQHPLWCYSSVVSGSGYSADNGTTSLWANRAIVVYDGSGAEDIDCNIVARAWVRPFAATEDSPYSRAYPYLTAISVTGTATLTVTTWTQERGYEHRRSDTVVVTDTAHPGQFITGLDCYWDVVPGWNKFYIRLEGDETISGAITVYGVSANQIVKRSH